MLISVTDFIISIYDKSLHTALIGAIGPLDIVFDLSSGHTDVPPQIF